MMELINIAELKRRIRDNKILTHAEVEYVIDCIDGQSEAYGIDKVVEELEKELQFYENRMSEMGGTDRDIEDWGAIKRLKDAIEIVKAGGKNGN